MNQHSDHELISTIVEHLNVGIFAIDENMQVIAWNNFMAAHSGQLPQDVIGQDLFSCFPELPEKWLRKKIQSVFVLKSFAFISWEQRAHLFRFKHNRQLTRELEYMAQDVTLMPIQNNTGKVVGVSFCLQDATDTCIYQNQLEMTKERLERASQTDGLTGLNNRRHWEQRLREEFGRAIRTKSAFTLILLDLDNFKEINDKYGHLAGDEVLRFVATIIKNCLREYDVCGRYGGEEFGIFLPNSSLSAATIVAERIRIAIQNQPCQYNLKIIPVTASFGLASATGRIVDHEKLISHADIALYRSKEQGRNKYTIFGQW